MLVIYVRNRRQQGQLRHGSGPLELGRGPARPDKVRYCIQDPTVSKDQLRVEELSNGQLRIENLSTKNHVTLGDGASIAPGAASEIGLPARLTAGNTLIEVHQEETEEPESDVLRTVARPLGWTGIQAAPTLGSLGDSPLPETLVRWFETVVAVQRSAASSAEFYADTARAVVDLVGLDCGLVLHREGDAWTVLARHYRQNRGTDTESIEDLLRSSRLAGGRREFSGTVLQQMVAQRRTYFEALADVDLTASLSHVEAVVASPVFDRQGEVAGAVYGARYHGRGVSPTIKPLEAQVVQVLAAAVGAGLARLESEAEALRRRVELEQMQTKLNVARDIQAGFFPRALPDVPGYELAGRSQPADTVGGDYFDALLTPNGGVALAIADVSGKGLPASLLMASMRATLRGLVMHEPEPARLVTSLNNALYDELASRRRWFITMLYGVLDADRHRLHYVNAGHGPVVLHLRAADGAFRTLPAEDDPARGLPLGVDHAPYQACLPAALGPGDLVVLGSDGIVETRSEGEQFGLERLKRLLLQHRDAPLPRIIDAVTEATTVFARRALPDDDLTMLLVRRKA
jgi:serine phosphatase RsbU (regulator of sigma subunit)